MIETYTKQTLEDTKKLANQIAGFLKSGDVLLLKGDLGAGKTAFTRMLVEALGGHDIRVSSPTFTVLQIYKDNGLKFPIYHFDAYRLEGIGGMDQGYEDYIYGDGVSIVEWPEYLADILPDKVITLTFERDEKDPENFRTITVEK